MSVRAYPAYKDSGIDLIEQVPAHWIVCRLKHGLSAIESGGTPETSDSRNWADADSGVPWVAISDMSDTQIVVSTAKSISERGISEKRLRIWPPGTLLFSMYASLGHTASLGVAAAINQAILALIPSVNIDQSFLSWWLAHLKPRLVEQANSNTQDNLNASKVMNLPLLSPSMMEQSAIAAFLDRETGKIDALVAEQERLMALLKEKRQAVISQAVTKGLNPNAKMKPSGVEWLGVVPEHWHVTRLKFVVRSDGTGIQIGPFGAMLTDLPTHPTGFKLYGQQNIISGDFSAGSRWITGESFKSGPQYAATPGDLLVTRKGSLGNCRIIPADITPGWFDSDSICLRVDPTQITSNFLQLLLHEVDYIERQVSETRRGAILSGINSEVIGNLVVVVPPIAVQGEILRNLEADMRRFEALFSDAARTVALLKERRSALISAAVTGKIDVRDAVRTGAAAA